MSKEEIFTRGKLFELVHLPQEDGRIFEVARRAPGVRVIVNDKKEGRVLLTREYRQELGDWDYRLPGGKVFDTLEEFETHRVSGNEILEAATKKAQAEGAEEAGLALSGLKLFRKSTLGATVEWDLYVFETDQWEAHTDGQQLEAGEQIEAGVWVTYDEAEQMILIGQMQEERIALVLLQWIYKQKEL